MNSQKELSAQLSSANDKDRRWIRISIRALVGIVVLVVLTEGVLRFGLGLGNPVLVVRDPACAYIVKPDQDHFRFFAHTHINHFGMRSDEVPPLHNPNTLRIFFLGDSLTYGTSRVDQSKIFTEILHRQLPAIIQRPVEVLNASASAWAPDNEVSYIRSRGIFGSDLVVLVLNDGDVYQPRSMIGQVGEDLPKVRPATAIGELYSRYLKPRFLSAVGKQDAGLVITPESDAIIKSNLADLDSAFKLVTSQGSRLVIVFLPFRLDVPDKSANAQSILQKWTFDHGVPLLDMTSAEIPYSIREIDLDNGYHFNERGNAVVAKEIERLWPTAVGR